MDIMKKVLLLICLIGLTCNLRSADLLNGYDISGGKIETFPDIRISYLINMGYWGRSEVGYLRIDHPLRMNLLHPDSLQFYSRGMSVFEYSQRGEVVKVTAGGKTKVNIKYTTKVIAGNEYYVGMSISYPADKYNGAITKDFKIKWKMYNNVPKATALEINDSKNGKCSFKYSMEMCPATHRRQLCCVYTIDGKILSKSFKVMNGDNINLYFYRTAGNSLTLYLQKNFLKFDKEYKLMEVRSEKGGRTKYEYYCDKTKPAVYGKVKKIFLPNSKVKEYTYYSDGIIKNCGTF